MRKLLNALLLLVLITAIWGANHGEQKKESGESLYSSEIQYGLAYGSQWPNFANVRRSENGSGKNQKPVGNNRNSVGTNSDLSPTGETKEQTLVSGRIVDRLKRGSNCNTDDNLGNFTITAYTNSPSDTGKGPGEPGFGITASGAHTKVGQTVAADWSVLPEGTVIKIEGLPGRYIVEDSGSLVHGQHIDLFVGCEATAVVWGVKQRKVTIIRRGDTQ